VICPRCRREAEEGTLFCPGCGAPLSLRPEPAPAALDASLTLDRRLDGPELPAPQPTPAPTPAPPRRTAPAPATRPRAASAAIPAPRPAPATPPPPRAAAVAPPPSGRPPPAAPRSPPPPAALAPDPPAAPGRGLYLGPELDPEVEVAPMEIHLRRASELRRVLSWAIDGIPFLALFALALRATLERLPHAGPLSAAGVVDLAIAEARGITLPMLSCAVILFAVYHALAHGLAGATLGKRLLGLRVVGPDGNRPGLGRSVVRAIVATVSLGLLGLGVLLALFTRSGRALHDLVARTWVVEAP